MIKFDLEAPWQRFAKMLKALFERDPDITVGEICEDENEDYVVDIEVRNHEKFLALDRLLPGSKDFGMVTLRLALYDEENRAVDPAELFRTLFRGNPILREVITRPDPAGVAWNYVVFEPEVIQFFDDNLADYQGNWSGLAQDIAPEVFEGNAGGVHFCTGIPDDAASLKKWP